ncbi:hypothetical protein D3C76_1423110 [compost metagenome]
MFSKVFTGSDAEFGRQQLDQHRHDVGPYHHPQQRVAKRSASLNISGKITGVDIADGGDKGRPHQRKFDLSGRAAGGIVNRATVQHSENPY